MKIFSLNSCEVCVVLTCPGLSFCFCYTEDKQNKSHNSGACLCLKTRLLTGMATVILIAIKGLFHTFILER